MYYTALCGYNARMLNIIHLCACLELCLSEHEECIRTTKLALAQEFKPVPCPDRLLHLWHFKIKVYQYASDLCISPSDATGFTNFRNQSWNYSGLSQACMQSLQVLTFFPFCFFLSIHFDSSLNDVSDPLSLSFVGKRRKWFQPRSRSVLLRE
jgi:hypothetical protein